MENPSVLQTTSKNQVDLQDLNNSNLFRRRKISSSNTYAAHMRIINNIRMQRASRFSLKKQEINNIIENSLNQRLFADSNQTTDLKGQTNNKNQGLNRGGAGFPGFAQNKAPIMINLSGLSGAGGNGDFDFKLYQYKKQQAELKRNQLEDELKENHPYFDKPLFSIGRESNLRNVCKMIVEARYQRKTFQRDQNTSATQDKYKQFYKFLGLVPYLDWIMIAMTIQSCIGMMFETPTYRLADSLPLQIVELIFVVSMGIEMTLKVCAYGLFFTPNAVVKDFGGILDLFIFTVSVLFLYLLPKEVMANSSAQMLMLLRCIRPLRIFTLVPHMRKVIYELCRGFKEILLVSVLLVVLMFIFANYGIQIYGGRLARCNDVTIQNKKNCTGLFKRDLYVTKLKLNSRNSNKPSIWVPRVWSNPYNFNFDSIGDSMLALFEVLSLEGWLEVRDVIIDRMGPRHAIFVHVFVFIGTLIGLTLFVGVVITNYSENKVTLFNLN